MSYWIKPKKYNTDAFADDIAQFQLAVSANTESIQNETNPSILHRELFYFDPNRASDDEWERLGLNERQIRNIRNYQASGGSFNKKEDLQKLYTISTTLYQLLEPYIRIAGNREISNRVTSEKVATVYPSSPSTSGRTGSGYTKVIVDLNNADSALLTLLPGIGPVLATRTLRYRNLLGGFANVEQISEVYGVNKELVERLSDQISIDTSLIRKIHINKATLYELTKHPYLNEQQARGILTYRRLQTRIDNLDDLIKNNILEPETAQKIRPYLSFE